MNGVIALPPAMLAASSPELRQVIDIAIPSDAVAGDEPLQGTQFNNYSPAQFYGGQPSQTHPPPDAPMRNAEHGGSLAHSDCKNFVHRVTPI
jgi:hypothetical protein